MKKNLKILLVILILLQFLFLGLFGYAFMKKEDGEIALELLHYQNKADFSYQVNLKENEIVDSESLNVTFKLKCPLFQNGLQVRMSY